MRFPLFIAKRYLFAKSGTNAINIITLVSVLSIIIGTALLLVVLSAFSGLKEFNLSVISTIDPDIKVLPSSGKTINLSEIEKKRLNKIEGIEAFSKIIEERVYLEYNGKTHLGYLKGVDENFLQVNRIDTTVFAGSWPQADVPEVAVGIGVRRKLSLGLNDYQNLLKIMVPKPGKGQITDPSKAFDKSSAIASGLFQAGETIDNDHIYANIDFVGDLLNYPLDKVSSIEIKLKSQELEDSVRQELSEILGNKVVLKNRIELNDTLYKMLNTENVALYFICTLVLIIALFSFIGSLIMIIIDKRNHIKTFSDVGASIQSIRQTFFYQGSLMVLLGGFLGIILGILIVTIQKKWGLVAITQELAYPVDLTFINIIIVLFTILVLGLSASKLASTRITHKLIRAS